MKLIKKLITIIFCIAILFIGLIVYGGYSMYKNGIEEIDLDTKINQIRSDNDYVVFDDLPKAYVSAVVDIEDHRFYTHKGIDIISIARAVMTNIKERSLKEGGSTITQQLAKNMYFTQEKSFVRKVAEIFLVNDLEKNYEKEDILELYVNISYFGDGYYGVGQAAKGYFNKQACDLTLYESTLLAGIPNAPSVYAPTKNPKLASERQKQVIKRMEDLGHITGEGAQKLYDEIEKILISN